MTVRRNKLILLCVLGCLGVGLAMFSRLSNSAAGVTGLSLAASDNASSEQKSEKQHRENAGGPDLFTNMMIAVLFVAALGIGAVYISKKLLPRFTNMPGKEIQVAETVYIGHRRALHLVKVNGQQLLIGSTNEQITRLAEVGETTKEIDFQAVQAAER